MRHDEPATDIDALEPEVRRNPQPSCLARPSYGLTAGGDAESPALAAFSPCGEYRLTASVKVVGVEKGRLS